jgi:NADH-quinone oxidoreductase subunit M
VVETAVNSISFPILSLIVLVPLLGALLLLWLKDDLQIKRLSLLITTVDLMLTITLLVHFNPATHLMQFSESYEWIPALGIRFSLAVDGISVLLVFLSAFLGWICILASWRAIEVNVKGFMVSLLVMQALMLGVFCAMDLFLFFMFWEAMLIPMYLIIGVWGGDNRIYAAFKFFLYTLAGSVLFLVGIIVLYFQGGQSFDIPTLMQAEYSVTTQRWVFIAFFIAFAVKVPMFPFHTWLPDAHVQAPTAGSIVLAGVLLKMGAYGFLRFSLPMLPDASHYFALPVVLISLVGIIYGGYLALAQDDLKKLVAYSSISHMGFVTLGLFVNNVAGLEGGILQMFSHGITTSALFLMVGLVYERSHTRDIRQYGGLMKVMPVYTTGLAFFALASMALPGTSAFIGELLVLVGAFAFNKLIAALAVIGALLSAGYLLSMFKRVALGKVTNQTLMKSWDLDARELVAVISLAIFVIWIGFYPMPFLELMHASVDHLLQQTNAHTMLTDR